MYLETVCRIFSLVFVGFCGWAWFEIIGKYKGFSYSRDRGEGGRFNGEKSLCFLLKDGRKIPIFGMVAFHFLTAFILWAVWFKM